MACGCSQSGAPARSTQRSAKAQAATAGAQVQYQVLNARGTPIPQRYTTLVAATAHARRIGGTTRPVA